VPPTRNVKIPLTRELRAVGITTEAALASNLPKRCPKEKPKYKGQAKHQLKHKRQVKRKRK
jgi:hypothetical protein